MKKQCNLCSQSFNVEDPDLELRMRKHEQFHKEYGKKNLVHDDVEWSVIE